MSRILLVDSGRELIDSLSALLTADGFEVELATDGETGFARASSGEFDLVILGTYPGTNICRELRKIGVDTSILTFSSKTVAALRLGADDCVPRSCDPNELMARVEALLRRVPKASRGPVRTLRFGDVEVDFALAEVRKAGRRVSLSSKELRLLQYLVSHRERVVSRKELLSNVWEYAGFAKSWKMTRNIPDIL